VLQYIRTEQEPEQEQRHNNNTNENNVTTITQTSFFFAQAIRYNEAYGQTKTISAAIEHGRGT
jgi:hypothetical protein